MLDTKNAESTYEIKDLENGVTYYFALTAVDKSGNESASYSSEVNAMPQVVNPTDGGDAEDKIAPTVEKAQAVSNTEVKVVFSEGIKLPKENPENEFTIEDQENKQNLTIASAALDANDSTQKTVILNTEKQETGKTYLLTAGLNITDLNGNPVESGTSDTATFVAKGEGEKSPEDSTPPEIISATALSTIKVEVVFSEDIIFDSKDDFTIYESKDDTKKIEITKVEYSENQRAVMLETKEQTPGQEYILSVKNISDKNGNLIEGFQSTSFFITPSKNLSDLIPPEDVTNFIAKLKGNIAELTWTASKNSASDLADQLLYQSSDKGKTYSAPKSLGPKVTSYQAKDLKSGIEYMFKLTTKDFSGNESKGVTTKIKIPATGSGLGLILISSLGLSGFLVRKKKR